LGIGPDLEHVTVDIYDPWKDHWTTGLSLEAKIVLPAFQRSLVVRIRLGEASNP
jgi:hypothetical protein